MARLVRQRKTFKVDDAGKRVPKGTPGAMKKSEDLAKWYDQGIPRMPPTKRVPLATHKRVAEQMLAKLMEKAERGVNQLPDVNAGRQPPASLVTEFEKAVGRKAGPARRRQRPAGRGVRSRPVGGMSEVNATVVSKHARQFTRWLWRKREVLDHDPLARVDLPSQATVNKRRSPPHRSPI